jgi:cysteinyl-tRNA synthetase, unknown class
MVLISVCSDNGTDPNDSDERDYKQDMRNFVQEISSYAKGIKSNFIIIPQNGHELLTVNGEETGNPATVYINAIDGVGREDLFYGYESDDVATPVSDRNYMVTFMDKAENNGVQVLVTDYCSTNSFMDDSYLQNTTKGYISFAANHCELDNIPAYPATPYNANDSNIADLSEAKNFLYLLNPGSYSAKQSFLAALKNTNFDVIIIDLF